MKKKGILNPQILDVIGKAGHRDMIAVTDRGFPLVMHERTRVIDVSIVPNMPKVLDVVLPLLDELVVEEIIVARETVDRQPQLLEAIRRKLPDLRETVVSHADLKQQVLYSAMKDEQMAVQIRTGEFSPFATVVLVCGVAFA